MGGRSRGAGCNILFYVVEIEGFKNLRIEELENWRIGEFRDWGIEN
jgi:hypothetical protein